MVTYQWLHLEETFLFAVATINCLYILREGWGLVNPSSSLATPLPPVFGMLTTPNLMQVSM